jgi:hypothetical protein
VSRNRALHRPRPFAPPNPIHQRPRDTRDAATGPVSRIRVPLHHDDAHAVNGHEGVRHPLHNRSCLRALPTRLMSGKCENDCCVRAKKHAHALLARWSYRPREALCALCKCRFLAGADV